MVRRKGKVQRWGVKLGIDFGTTRIIVAAADRGN
jgi:molecular chaperone DnaK (HSP70)